MMTYIQYIPWCFQPLWWRQQVWAEGGFDGYGYEHRILHISPHLLASRLQQGFDDHWMNQWRDGLLASWKIAASGFFRCQLRSPVAGERMSRGLGVNWRLRASSLSILLPQWSRLYSLTPFVCVFVCFVCLFNEIIEDPIYN